MIASDRALVDRFLDMMAAEMGAARNTLAAYRSDLGAAAADLESLEHAQSDALALLGEKWGDLAPSTVARRAAALRRFYGFLHDDGLRGYQSRRPAGLFCCGYGPALEYNGDLYSCDHFVEPRFKLGNIHDTHMLKLIDARCGRRLRE